MHVAERGEGPLVVLLHGFPESWYSWRHQLAALADAGFRAVAPDQRGYGGTTRPEAIDRYTLLDLVGDVVGLIDALGEQRAIVVGHDWGAPVAWHTALLRPDLVAGVAGLSVPFTPRMPPSPMAGWREAFGDRFYQVYFQEPGVAERELEADVRETMRRLLIGASGDRPAPDGDGERLPAGVLPPAAGSSTRCARPTSCRRGSREADLDFYVGRVRADGLHRRAELVPQPGPQLGAARPVARRGRHAARAVRRGHARPRVRVPRHGPPAAEPADVRAEPARLGAARRRRALDAAGAPGRGQRAPRRVLPRRAELSPAPSAMSSARCTHARAQLAPLDALLELAVAAGVDDDDRVEVGGLDLVEVAVEDPRAVLGAQHRVRAGRAAARAGARQLDVLADQRDQRARLARRRRGRCAGGRSPGGRCAAASVGARAVRVAVAPGEPLRELLHALGPEDARQVRGAAARRRDDRPRQRVAELARERAAALELAVVGVQRAAAALARRRGELGARAASRRGSPSGRARARSSRA